jgi:hypothetical protein
MSMSGEIALDTSVAIRFLNGDVGVTERVLVLPEIILPMVVVGGITSKNDAPHRYKNSVEYY